MSRLLSLKNRYSSELAGRTCGAQSVFIYHSSLSEPGSVPQDARTGAGGNGRRSGV